jgi:hypothetical protein
LLSRGQPRHRSGTDETNLPPVLPGKTHIDNNQNEPTTHSRRATIIGFPGGKVFEGIKKIFSPGMGTVPADPFNLPPKMCLSASLPTREVTHWVSKEREIKSLIRIV